MCMVPAVCLYLYICGVFYHALQRNLNLCIPRKGIARPQSQFSHLCVCERSIYSHVWPTYFPAAEQAERSEEFINRSQKHESRNADCSRAVHFLGIFISNFLYCVLYLCSKTVCTAVKYPAVYLQQGILLCIYTVERCAVVYLCSSLVSCSKLFKKEVSYSVTVQQRGVLRLCTIVRCPALYFCIDKMSCSKFVPQ